MHYEIYTIKGRKYKYEVRNYREGNKIKHIKKYIGAVDPVNKQIRKKGSGRKALLFVRELTKDEIIEIEKLTKSSNSYTRDRANIVLLSSKKTSSKNICQKYSFEIRKVRNAIKSFNINGNYALQRKKAKGANPKFTEDCKKIILLHFSKKPMEYDHAYTTWTLPRFRKHLIEYNVVESISIEKVRQILDDAGARLKKSKRWQYSPDKEFEKKNN